MSFKKQLEESALNIENRICEIFREKMNPAEASVLREAMEYSVLGGGKRLRGYLITEFCRLCGKDPQAAADYACAMEMIQAFSLIHDDLPAMDNDDMRRGKPSNHKAFGEATAILAGDALALDAFSVAGRNNFCDASQNAEAMVLLSEKSGLRGMCGGQQLDIEGEGKKLDLDGILKIISLKTGALFQCSCRLGCIAANATEEQKQAAEDFGLLTGRAFQITDDLLDINSTPEELGKSVGKDIYQEKSTFVSVLGEEGAKKLALESINKAKESLNRFPDGEAKERLLRFCDYILIRKK